MSGRRRARALGALLAMLMTVSVAAALPAGAQPRFSVLVFSKVTNFYHDSIPAGIAAIEQLGEQHGFEVEATDDASAFTDDNLARFDALVFNNTNSTPDSGDLLDADQRAALQRYVQGGGGWVGLHAASASERDTARSLRCASLRPRPAGAGGNYEGMLS